MNCLNAKKISSVRSASCADKNLMINKKYFSTNFAAPGFPEAIIIYLLFTKNDGERERPRRPIISRLVSPSALAADVTASQGAINPPCIPHEYTQTSPSPSFFSVQHHPRHMTGWSTRNIFKGSRENMSALCRCGARLRGEIYLPPLAPGR